MSPEKPHMSTVGVFIRVCVPGPRLLSRDRLKFREEDVHAYDEIYGRGPTTALNLV